ncbi:unnamed protein product, partial [Polarella glacialis]
MGAACASGPQFENDPELCALPSLPGPYEVTVVQTAAGTGNRLTPVAPLLLEPGAGPKLGKASVVVDSSVRYQSFLGFGGSFTEASAEIWRKLSPAKQDRLIDAYFRE